MKQTRLIYLRIRYAAFLLVMAVSLFPVQAKASLGIEPPDLDYQSICLKQENLQRDTFDWTGKTPANSGLSPERLIMIAKLYFYGSAETAPDYQLSKQIIDYLLRSGGEYMDDSLQLKFQMYWQGKGVERNIGEARRILDRMVSENQPEAFGYYGDLLAEEGEYRQAADYYRQAYALGRLEAAVSLAYLYYERKLPASDEERVAFVIQAQDALMSYIGQGRCNALTLFGLMYERLTDIPDAARLSAKWFEKAATLDEVTAKLYLAEIIQRGFVMKYNEKRFLQLWQEAAALGSNRAMYLLGEYAFLKNNESNKSLQEAIRWLTKSANWGNVRAMELLASLYDGRYPDLADSASYKLWLERAAQQPIAKDRTYLSLAALYEQEGIVPPKDIFALYQKAAEDNNSKAYLKLGDFFRYGIGVDAQPTRSLRYYRLAASNGEGRAMKELRQAYACEIGVAYDADKIQFWTEQMNFFSAGAKRVEAEETLQKFSTDAEKIQKLKDDLTILAVSRQDAEAMIMLGIAYQKSGESVQAENWFNKALKTDQNQLDDMAGHTLYGTFLLHGEFVDRNAQKAVELLDIAANYGNADALNELAEFYENQGQKQKARSYYERAARSGEIAAYLDLAEMDIAQGQIQNAVMSLESAARHQNIEAHFKLIEGYHNEGWIGQPNPEKIPELFERVLASYPCKASDIIAVLEVYTDGRYGLPKDEKKAEEWLQKLSRSSDQSPKDKMKVAKLILNSDLPFLNIKRDQALQDLKDMANEGSNEAIAILVSLYHDKSLDGGSPEEALGWLQKSAENGDTKSMLELANMYISGFGVTPSIDEATKWLLRASELGDPEAQSKLEIMNR